MDQYDAENRIAELECELADQKRMAELERARMDDATQHAHGIRTEESFDYPGDGGPPLFSGPQAFGATAGVGLQPAAGAGVRRLRFRANGKLTALIVAPFIAGYFTEAVAPPSALWMSGIVCSSPYHLKFNATYTTASSGTSGLQSSFQCANYGSSHPVSELTIIAVQTMLIALVLWAAAVIGFLTWRLSRMRWLTSTVVTVAIVVALTGVFAYGITSTPTRGPKQLHSADGLRALLSFTRDWFGDTMGYSLSVDTNSATLSRPDPHNNRLERTYYYSQGKWNQNLEAEWRDSGGSSSKRSSSDVLADLSKFDVPAVTAMLPGAAQDLNINDAKDTTLDVKGAAGGSLALSIRVSDGEDGTMDLNPDGSVKALHPPS
jgi:hypothetical protein